MNILARFVCIVLYVISFYMTYKVGGWMLPVALMAFGTASNIENYDSFLKRRTNEYD